MLTPILLSLLLATAPTLQQEDFVPVMPADGAMLPVGDFTAPETSAVQSLILSSSLSGRVSGDSSNTRPVTVGLGFSRWSSTWALQAQAHHAPRFGAASVPNEEGSLLMRPGGRYGLTLGVHLHELTHLGSANITVGAYLLGDGSLDSAPTATGGDRSWTSLRGDMGGGIYWWFSRRPGHAAYASLEAGPVLRRRAGLEAGTWVGMGSTLSLTFNQVSLFASSSYLASGNTKVPGLTGGHVYAGLSVTASALEL